MQLEFKYIAPYLPYKLIFQHGNKEYHSLRTNELEGIVLANGNISIKSMKNTHIAFLNEIRPILRPLSGYKDLFSTEMNALNLDISQQIELSEFAFKRISLSQLSFSTAQVCFENHIDVFNLIPEGLAVAYP